jgi:outer membrane immunogenic protein
LRHALREIPVTMCPNCDSLPKVHLLRVGSQKLVVSEVRGMRRALVGAVALAALSSTALADGYATRGAVYVDQFSWTGLYVGLHTGWERKRIEGSDFTSFDGQDFLLTDGFSTAAPTKQRIEGWIGGGQIGYNHQFGHIVVGTELSGTFGRVEGTSNCFRAGAPVGTTSTGGEFPTTDTVVKGCRAEQNWSVQWLNKLGRAFGDQGRLLGYVTGGIAVTELKINRNASDTFTDGDFTSIESAKWSGRHTYAGVVLGGGLQYAFTNNVSLGVEYLHTVYADADTLTRGSSTCNTECTDGPLSSNAVQNIQSDTIRAVLNFKFSHGVAAPLK